MAGEHFFDHSVFLSIWHGKVIFWIFNVGGCSIYCSISITSKLRGTLSLSLNLLWRLFHWTININTMGMCNNANYPCALQACLRILKQRMKIDWYYSVRILYFFAYLTIPTTTLLHFEVFALFAVRLSLMSIIFTWMEQTKDSENDFGILEKCCMTHRRSI